MRVRPSRVGDRESPKRPGDAGSAAPQPVTDGLAPSRPHLVGPGPVGPVTAAFTVDESVPLLRCGRTYRAAAAALSAAMASSAEPEYGELGKRAEVPSG